MMKKKMEMAKRTKVKIMKKILNKKKKRRYE